MQPLRIVLQGASTDTAHWFDSSQANPNILFFANDGGIYRTLSALNANGIPASCPANPPNTPFYPFDNLNGTMGSMTQFVWFSQHPSNQYTLLGGTQETGLPRSMPTIQAPTASPGEACKAVMAGTTTFIPMVRIGFRNDSRKYFSLRERH